MTCISFPLASSFSDVRCNDTTTCTTFSFLRTMTFLPSGKIYSACFCCECVSCTGPLCSQLPLIKHYYQTILASSLPFDDPMTNLCSPRTSLVAAHYDNYSPLLCLLDHNDQWLRLGSDKC